MPLESLSDEQINIHDLALEQEKKPMSESEKLYEELKNSSFYNPEKGQWVRTISEDQEVQQSSRRSLDQLLAVAFESKIDKNMAQKTLERNMATELYYKDLDKWAQGIDGFDDLDPMMDTITQLSSIYATYLLDPSRARSLREKLATFSMDLSSSGLSKETLMYYDKPNVKWKFTDTNLSKEYFGVLVDSLFDKEKASKQFQEMKDTIYRSRFNDRKILKSTCADQLMGVLLEAQFDKKAAENYFSELKKSKFYDKNAKQWNVHFDQYDNRLFTNRETFDQLVGLLCEQEFEEPNPNLQSSTPEIPETRKY